MTDNQLLRSHGLDLLCLNCEHAYDIRSTSDGILRAPLLSPGRATLGFCCEIADVMKHGKEQHILLHQIRTKCEHYVQKEEKENTENKSYKRSGYVAPNLSEHINPKDCQKCGAACCKHFSIFYHKSNEPVILSEAQRFKLLFGDLVDVIEHENHIEVDFKIPCPQLDENNQCKIYYNRELRPLLCRMYPYENTFDCPYMIKEDKE